MCTDHSRFGIFQYETRRRLNAETLRCEQEKIRSGFAVSYFVSGRDCREASA